MFAETGRFSSLVYMRMFSSRDDFTRDLICKVSIESSSQSWTECLCDKNCPALPGRDEKRPCQIISIYKRNGTSKRYLHAWRDHV